MNFEHIIKTARATTPSTVPVAAVFYSGIEWVCEFADGVTVRGNEHANDDHESRAYAEPPVQLPFHYVSVATTARRGEDFLPHDASGKIERHTGGFMPHVAAALLAFDAEHKRGCRIISEMMAKAA